jgi:hypothetical protein
VHGQQQEFMPFQTSKGHRQFSMLMCVYEVFLFTGQELVLGQFCFAFFCSSCVCTEWPLGKQMFAASNNQEFRLSVGLRSAPADAYTPDWQPWYDMVQCCHQQRSALRIAPKLRRG